jgi:hypothetical protein
MVTVLASAGIGDSGKRLTATTSGLIISVVSSLLSILFLSFHFSYSLKLINFAYKLSLPSEIFFLLAGVIAWRTRWTASWSPPVAGCQKIKLKKIKPEIIKVKVKNIIVIIHCYCVHYYCDYYSVSLSSAPCFISLFYNRWLMAKA